MIRTRIKFCGMTRAEDLAVAAELGVDAIGLIFAARSPRRVELSQAIQLRRALPPFVAVVALCMDNPPAEVRAIASTLRPALIQFHGRELATDCVGCGLPYLKAVPMGGGIEPGRLIAAHPRAAGFVFDAHALGEAGGSGQVFDWSQLPLCPGQARVLAGGLTPDNVYAAVRQARPYAVDVASGIESEPGVKAREQMQRFVAEVRRADADLA